MLSKLKFTGYFSAFVVLLGLVSLGCNGVSTTETETSVPTSTSTDDTDVAQEGCCGKCDGDKSEETSCCGKCEGEKSGEATCCQNSQTSETSVKTESSACPECKTKKPCDACKKPQEDETT